MIDHTANPDTAEHFDLEVASRVRGLPPYLFGKINELKYRKRRDGIDVIDLGMGNPTDPPEEWVIDKLCEAARDTKNHRYSAAAGVYNIWLMDPAHPDAPARQITFDAAWNDCPAWDATGKFYDFKTRTLMSFRPPA